MAECELASSVANNPVIYEPDLVARRDRIYEQLSTLDRTDVQLRKRVRRHDTLIAHMEVSYSTAHKRWYRSPRFQKDGEGKPGRASMETKESRDEFVRKGLEQERAVMRTKGGSEKTAIELE
jgi:hypothetical protein